MKWPSTYDSHRRCAPRANLASFPSLLPDSDCCAWRFPCPLFPAPTETATRCLSREPVTKTRAVKNEKLHRFLLVEVLCSLQTMASA